MSKSRLTFFVTFLITLITGIGLFYALPVLAQGYGLNENFASVAGFSTDLDIRIMIARLIRTAISFAGIVLVILIIYGGFVWMTAAGSPERVDKAKKILTNAVIGIVIVVASFAITSFILGALTDAVGGGVISEDDSNSGFYSDNSGSSSAFVLTSVNTECASALKNLQLQMIFSKSVNENLVIAGGIRVRPADGGADVAGTYVVSSRKVTFTPDQICPEDPNEYCFDGETQYQITLDPAILKSGSGTVLTCDTLHPCQFSFTTGVGIDLTGPTVAVDAPEAGQSLMVNNIELLQSFAEDNTGVSSVEFTVDGELIFNAGLTNSTVGSLTPANYFHTDDTQWETTGYVTNGSYSIRARGFDCSGRSDSATITAMLRAENCFNTIQDVDFGETDIDCGGGSNNEFYCGACVGDQCTSNEDCSSGVCENGFCIGATIIERVSPGDGAVGNLITISGRGFGNEPGSIVFVGTDDGGADDSVISDPYECQGADTWTDTQIIIQLQEGVVSGPIKIQTTELKEDFTNDQAGPYISDFQINDIIRPGLCNLNPAISTANEQIRFLGNNFGANRNSSTAFFGNYYASSYAPDWTDNEFGAVVPLVNSGRYHAQVFVGDNYCSVSTDKRCRDNSSCPENETCVIGRQGSNRLNFQVLAEDSAATPIINYIDTGWKACVNDPNTPRCASDANCQTGACVAAPNWGPPGQYVSIFGSNFGSAIGKVKFENVSNPVKRGLGDTNFPDVCEEADFWQDDIITIKVPKQYQDGSDYEFLPNNFNLFIERQEGTVSNQIEFNIIDDQPGPAICDLDPAAGPTRSDVTIFGENFGDNNAQVWFTPELEATGKQTSQTFKTQVPADAQTGNVYLVNQADYGSNKLPFTVGDCRDENICKSGKNCCADGTCRVSCPVTDASNYAYRFFTGPVLVVPEVVQVCDGAGLGIISPTPWEGHTRSQDICVNAVVSASFRIGSDYNPVMDVTTFNNNNITVDKCLDDQCSQTQAINGEFVDPESSHSSFTWKPTNQEGEPIDFEMNTLYRVTLIGYGAGNASAIQADNGEYLQNNYVWTFTTANSNTPCSVGALMVSPGQFTAKQKDEQVKYLSQPSAAGDGAQCILLDCRAFDYEWESEDPISAPLLEDMRTACGIRAEAKVETKPNDSIDIESELIYLDTITTTDDKGVTSTIQISRASGISGDGQLSIHFTDPEIVSYWPNCDTACVNAEIGARFNIDMKAEQFSGGNSLLKIWQCDNEACLVPSPIDDYTSTFNHEDYSLHVSVSDNLLPNTYYRVDFNADVESVSERKLSAVYGSSGFSWMFRTKNDPVFCRVDRVAVNPEQAKMTYIGQKQAFTALPYGAPDNCSTNGQILKAMSYTWRAWTATDDPDRVPTADVAFLQSSGSLALSSKMSSGCSSDCLHTGSAVKFGTVICGNSEREFGEDCDDGNTLDEDGCSKHCQNEGTDAPLCGNGDLDNGEECDNGSYCSDPNKTACTDDSQCVGLGDELCLPDLGDGCSARCLREGASAAGYTCGNGDVATRPSTAGTIGEECDDGNTNNGDGCSSQCLNEGSIFKDQVYSICGGVLSGQTNPEPGEDCDDGNIENGDGCSDRCLAEGTDACVSQCNNVVKNCTSDAQCDDEDPLTNDICVVQNAPCCGNGGAPETGENCDDGNPRSGDGCSSRCLLEGSSLNYRNPVVPSICGDGLINGGEICEAVGQLKPGPYSIAQADEGSVLELLAAPDDVYYVQSEIEAIVENTPSETVSGRAEFSLACVCETDAQCGNSANYGCGLRQCCFPRPSVGPMYPGDGTSNVCRNTAIYFEFDQVMDPATATGQDIRNFYLKLVNSDGSDVSASDCPEPYLFVSAPENQPWYARAWNWVIDFVLGFFGHPATAAIYQGCIVPDVGYGSEVVGNGSRLRINLKALLNENASYQVVALDDPDKNDGTPLGLLSKYSVGLKAGSISTFHVGKEICTLDTVIIEDLGKQPFDELDPSYTLFTKAAEVHRLQGEGYSFRNGIPQKIQPIDNVYDWEWSWATGYLDDSGSCPVDDPETPNINENENCLDNADKNVVATTNATAPDINPTQTDVVSANQDGQESAYAIASIITNQTCAGGANSGQQCSDDSACPDGTCVPEKIDGNLPLTVLLCSNPWPAADFPFVQSESNNTNNRGATNFGFYYCRDYGDPEKIDDDLPALAIQEVAVPPVGTDIYREFLFILEGAGEALGVRVMYNEGYLPPDMWYKAMGFTGSPSSETLDGYEAVREGNTIYATAANQTGDIYPNIYILSTTNNLSPEAQAIFDQIRENWTFNANTQTVTDYRLCVDNNYDFVTDPATGNFLPCNWDGDCASSICDAAKSKLTRDLQRLTDMVRVKSYITGSCSITPQSCSGNEDCPNIEACVNLDVPKLSEGSFLRAMTTSKWPSWQAVLGNELGVALPEDPLNVFSSCPGEPYDPESCFNAGEGLFTCATGSHIYGFNSSAQGSYSLHTKLEYDRAPWALPLDPVLGDNAEIIAEYDRYSSSINNPAINNMASKFSAFELSTNSFINRSYTRVDCFFFNCNTTLRDNVYELVVSIQTRQASIESMMSNPEIYDLGSIKANLKQIESAEYKIANLIQDANQWILGGGLFKSNYYSLQPYFDLAIADLTAFNASLVAPRELAAAGLLPGFRATANFCNGSTFGNSSECGDQIKAPNEICEIGETDVVACPGGQININCIEDILPGETEGVCHFETVTQAMDGGEPCRSFQCGNGTKEDDEECDDGALNGTYGRCSPDCTSEPQFYCGDGYLAGGEQCDCGTVQNYRTLPDSSWAKSGNCDIANGQYTINLSKSCAFDCTKPGPSCGDGLINGSEVCDTGNPDLNFQEVSCGTFDNDGREKFKSRTCNSACTDWDSWSACAAKGSCGDGIVQGTEECDDGNDNNNDACLKIDSNNDGIFECKLNVCGDGFINAGVESCDSGLQNGAVCNAPYNDICYYCTETCQYQSRSGAFCGDGIINGTEFCDGLNFKSFCFENEDDIRQSGDSCLNPGSSCSGSGRETILNPPTCRYLGVCNGGPDNGRPCTLSNDGQNSADAGGSDGAACATPGKCVPPKCASDCVQSCPFQFKQTALQIQSEILGATPQNEIELYSFGNAKANTPDNAVLFLPACQVATKLTASLDFSNVKLPKTAIVFLTDMSGSMISRPNGSWMNNSTPPPSNERRITLVSQAEIQAVQDLFDNFTIHNSDLQIGLVSYAMGRGQSGRYCTEKIEDGYVVDSELSDNQAELIQALNEYPTEQCYSSLDGKIGAYTSTYAGLEKALDMLKASDAQNKILVHLSDGDTATLNQINLTQCWKDPDDLDTFFNYYNGSFAHDMDTCFAVMVDKFIDPAITNGEIDEEYRKITKFTATISNNDVSRSYLEHLSSNECDLTTSNTFQGEGNCQPKDGINYAYNAVDAQGIADMFQNITSSILGVNFTLVTKENGQTIITSQTLVPEGATVELPLPESGLCDGVSGRSVPFRVQFGSDNSDFSRLLIKNPRLEYCPAP